MDRYWHFHIYLVLTDVDGFYFNACLKMKKFLYSMRNLTIISAKVVRQSSLMHCTLQVHDTSSPSPPFVLSCTFNHFHRISSHYDQPRNSGLVKPGAHTHDHWTRMVSCPKGSEHCLIYILSGVKGLLVSYMLFLECNISNFYF